MMQAWVVPRMGARHIRVETIIGNTGCVRVLEKNGFVLTETVCARRATTAGETIAGYHVLSLQLSD